MEQKNIKPYPIASTASNPYKWIAISLLMLVLIFTGFFYWKFWNSRIDTNTKIPVETLSAQAFEDRYGLRLRLIGVTAAGGMVDFRLKILDAEKATPLLSNPDAMPSLIVPESGLTLTAPQTQEHQIEYLDGGVYFVLFSNTGGAVKPGTSVIVSFGDFQLEPVSAQ